MRLLYVLISFGLLISSSFAYSQDYSKNIESFKSEVNSNKKEYAFTYKLPSDGYYFQISSDSTVVPFAIYIKYGELEYWSGFGGQTISSSFKQKDLTLEEKVKFIGIQPPLVRSALETKIKSSKPDPAKISGGIEGEKYLVVDQNGTKIAVVKKIGETMFQFRSKANVSLIDNHSKENEIFFQDEYIKYVYKELNIDPSKQSFVITKGKERDRIDKGICVLVDKPSDFYLEYFSQMNSMNRNFIGELIVYKEENKLLDEINASIRRVGGKEITSIFQNGDDLAEKTTEKIARGEVAYLDGIKSYGKILETDKRFSFQKKDGLEELTILVFSPLENSTFNVNLNQSPEGINQVYYKSGQLKEKYTLQNGKLNGEKITYYEDKNYKIGQDTKPIKEIITYLNGLKTGVHKEYDLNQNLVLEEELKDGIRNGKYKKCVNGKVIEEGNYVNNEKDGEWTTLNSSEKITQNYSKGKLNGAYKKYDGAVLKESGQYVEGMKNGEWKNFDYYGKLLELKNYKSDKFDGAFKKYSGDVVIEEGTYSNGLMNGEWVFRYRDGQVHAKGNFLNGNSTDLTRVHVGKEELQGSILSLPKSGREGLWSFYFSNGKLIERSNWKNGALHGDFVGYEYDDEFWRTKGKMSNGKLVGIWEFRYNLSSGVISLNQEFFEVDGAIHPSKEKDRADFLKEANKSIAANVEGFLSYQDIKYWLKLALDIREDSKTRALYEQYTEKYNNSYNSTRNRINSGESQTRTNSSNSTQNDNESCSKCQGSGKCIECGKEQRIKYYKNGWKNDEEIRPGKTVCTACQGDGITDEHISGGKMDDYKNCYVNTCSNGWIKCRRCNGNGKCDKCNGSGKKD